MLRISSDTVPMVRFLNRYSDIALALMVMGIIAISLWKVEFIVAMNPS